MSLRAPVTPGQVREQMHLKVGAPWEGRTQEPQAGRAGQKEEPSFRVEDYAFQETQRVSCMECGDSCAPPHLSQSVPQIRTTEGGLSKE